MNIEDLAREIEFQLKLAEDLLKRHDYDMLNKLLTQLKELLNKLRKKWKAIKEEGIYEKGDHILGLDERWLEELFLKYKKLYQSSEETVERKPIYKEAVGVGSFEGTFVKDKEEINFRFKFTDLQAKKKCRKYCLIQVQYFVSPKGEILDPPSLGRARKEDDAIGLILGNPIPRDMDSIDGYVVDAPPHPIPYGRRKVSPCLYPEPKRIRPLLDPSDPNSPRTKGLEAKDQPGDLKNLHEAYFETFAICIRPGITILASMRWRLSLRGTSLEVDIIKRGGSVDWDRASVPAQKALKKFLENHPS